MQDDLKELILNTTFNGEVYTVDINVGEPGQSFKMAYDISSYENFLSSTDCKTCNKGTFSSVKSNTFDGKLEYTSILYVNKTKKVSGNNSFDTFEINNVSLNLTTFFLANYSELSNWDGLIGFGYDYDASKLKNNSSILDMIISQKNMRSKLVTQRIINETSGKLILGSFPSEIATGKEAFTRCTVNSQISWGCEITHLLVGKQYNRLSDGYQLGNKTKYDTATFSTLT
jgi:hypothetical protein